MFYYIYILLDLTMLIAFLYAYSSIPIAGLTEHDPIVALKNILLYSICSFFLTFIYRKMMKI